MDTTIESRRPRKKNKLPNQTEQHISILWKIIPIFIGGTGLILSVINSIHINRQQYELNSLNYKPQLEISSQLTNFKYKSSVPYLKLREYKVDTSTNANIKKIEILYDTIEKGTKAQFSLDIDILIRNTGSENAIIMMDAFSDTTTSKKFNIRDIESDNIVPEFVKNAPRCFSSNRQINPQKEIHLYFKNEGDIYYFKNNIIRIQYWIVYKNSLGMYYDTYYWKSIQLNDSLLGSQINSIKSKLINPYESNELHPYTKKQSHQMKKYFDKIMRKIYKIMQHYNDG
jgi:hypothetical protein